MTEQTNYWMRAGANRLSRRAALRGAGVAGLGLAGAALIGCGDDEDEPEATSTAAGGSATSTATGTTAASNDPFPGVKRGGTLNFTLAGDPPTIAPYDNTSFLTKGFAAYAYSRLYKLGTAENLSAGEAAPAPDLAESAETEDGQHWTVHLRKGAKFHNIDPVNGREVTTEDVLFSWDAFNVDTNVNKESMAFITNVEAVDDYTLSYTLDAPSAIFLETLADGNLFYVLPTESDGGFDLALKAIGTGPWMLENYQAAQSIAWKKHPEYFIEGLPFADGVVQAIVPEYATRLAQFQAGNTHAEGINANDVLTLRSQNDELQWNGEVSALTSIFYFDHINNPDNVWSDPRVRQAVSRAIDRDAIMDLAYNVAELQDAGLDVSTAWNNLIPVGHTRFWLDPQSEAQGPSAQYFIYDAAEARKLLEAVSPGGLALKYQYTDNRYGSTFNSVAEANIGYLTDAGFNLEVEVQDYSSKYITQTSAGEFTGLAFGYETPFSEAGTYAQRPFAVDETGAPIEKNRARVDDPKLRELAAQQAGEFDFEARRELLYEVQRINAENMYYIPNQAGAGTGWAAYQPQLRGIRSTRGYGDGVETVPYYWLDA